MFSLNAVNISNGLDSVKRVANKLCNAAVLPLRNGTLDDMIDRVNAADVEPSENTRYQLIAVLLMTILKDEAGIIYCVHIQDCLWLQYYLKSCDIHNVMVYTSKTVKEEKQKFLKFWKSFKKPYAVIATNAFGMGIDKSTLGYVIQYDLFSTISDLVQQYGRCGRDGNPALCLQMFSYHDYDR